MCILKEISGDEFPISGNVLRPGPKPKFTDLDVICLSLTAECMGYDSENYLFNLLTSDYSNDFPHLISRRQYNDRRKWLFSTIEQLRQLLKNKLNKLTEIFAVDSMPLDVCKLARAERNKMGNDNDYYAPDRGFCASQQRHFFGYKLHAVCSPSGIIDVFNLTKASIHDVKFLKEVSHSMSNCLITGDRGYISKSLKEELLKKSNISLEVPYRENQKDKKPLFYPLRRVRKRVETVFSQLADQFNITKNYAKSFYGYRVRILSKICGMTVLQYINKYVHDSPIGKIKYSLK